MASKLEQLLDSIHPSRTIEEVDRRADEAINRFDMPGAQIDRWEEFRQLMVRFLCHVEASVLDLREPCSMDVEFGWGRCADFLAQAYGRNGEKAAFEMARAGTAGGFLGVLKKFARTVAQHYAGREIEARVSAYWTDLSVDEQLAAADEYLESYGHLLPAEVTEGHAATVRASFWKVLEEHPYLLQSLRRVGRT